LARAGSDYLGEPLRLLSAEGARLGETRRLLESLSGDILHGTIISTDPPGHGEAALLLARHVDAVLLLIPLQRARMADVRRLVEQIGRDRVLGAVTVKKAGVRTSEATPRVVSARADLRSRASLALAALTCLAGVLLLAPPLTRLQWIARLMVRETSLGLTVLGLIALVLARGRSDARAWWTRRASLAAAVVGLLPLLVPLPAFPAGHGLSVAEYVLPGALTPRVTVDRDVVLDPAAPDLKADVYQAPGAGPHPFVVVVHGGSWRGGDKGQAPHPSRQLAAAGYTVVDVRYRLAPRDPFPAAVADVKCLLGRLREQARERGLDARRAALLGRSAGGEIALVAAYSAGDTRLPPSCPVVDEPVAGVVAVYSPTDLVYGYETPMQPDVGQGTESLSLYLGGSPSERPEAYRLASPVAWVDRPLPPTLLVHGDADRIVRYEHSTRLQAALSGKGQAVRLVRVPMGEHGFDARPGGVGEQLARAAMLDFLRDTLRPIGER
jgi:acetyl esterase/lipase